MRNKNQELYKAKKLICDWFVKKYFINYRMLNFYVRHAIVVDKLHETISFKQKWLEKYITFNTQKRKKSKTRFEKKFYKLLENAFLE